jgi:hypothetical protein
VGESLPNWGPVAESGGRTVVMSNLFTDPDSLARITSSESAVYCRATRAKAGDYARGVLLTSLLHEASHNLGPAHDYTVGGHNDVVAFGGTLASTLEELKAENSSMFFNTWLRDKSIFSAEEADQLNYNAVTWTFGHISRGMYAADGTPRNYGQLAAIQLGSFISSGAITWKPGELAANGSDMGCLEIDFERLPAAVTALETTVLQIKARNDKAAAERLKARFVDAQDAFAAIKQTLTTRWLRAPKATLVYSLEF